MYKYLVAIPILALTACDSDSTPEAAANLAEAKEAVAENYAQWRYFDQQNYMFTLSHTNGIACGDTASGELPRLRITVQDGAVTSVYNADEADVEYDPQGLAYVGTIDHMFEWVLSELERDPQVVSHWYGRDVANELPTFNQSFHYIEGLYIQNVDSDRCLSTLLSVDSFN